MNAANEHNLIPVRRYGTAGDVVFVLHGGPGAPGYMAPVAQRLAEHFRVIEPFQRKGDPGAPLTVARHAADLQAVIEAYGGGQKPLLVGHSWGAMLALAWACEHPDAAAGIVLVGCGTFDPASRERMHATRQQRLQRHVFQRLQARIDAAKDPDERLKLQGKLMMQIDSCELMHVDDEVVFYDALGHEQTWQDMLRLQREAVYPAAFAGIACPILMLHGRQDPHPGAMIYEHLKSRLPQLTFHAWSHCGHYPWLEKAAHADFYAVLVDWLKQQRASE